MLLKILSERGKVGGFLSYKFQRVCVQRARATSYRLSLLITVPVRSSCKENKYDKKHGRKSSFPGDKRL